MNHSSSRLEFETARFLNVGTTTVCYRRAGSGPTIVFVHGYPVSGLTFRAIASFLTPFMTCYAFDLTGLGDSTSDEDNDYKSPGQAATLRRALETLGVSSYALLGNNSGGWVARELALIDGDRVNHLILTNTEIPGHRPPWIPSYQKIAQTLGGAPLFHRMLASWKWRHSNMGFGDAFMDSQRIDGDFGELFLLPLLESRGRLKRALRFLRNMSFRRMDQFRELHQRLGMPVSFIWGAADPTFPELEARAMAAQFPRAGSFVPVPNAKLYVHEERPDVVAYHICDFLRLSPHPELLTTR